MPTAKRTALFFYFNVNGLLSLFLAQNTVCTSQKSLGSCDIKSLQKVISGKMKTQRRGSSLVSVQMKRKNKYDSFLVLNGIVSI